MGKSGYLLYPAQDSSPGGEHHLALRTRGVLRLRLTDLTGSQKEGLVPGLTEPLSRSTVKLRTTVPPAHIWLSPEVCGSGQEGSTLRQREPLGGPRSQQGSGGGEQGHSPAPFAESS